MRSFLFSLIGFLLLNGASAFAQSFEALSAHKSFDAEFVVIPAGSFQMGSSKGEAGHQNDEKKHDVTITKDFEIQATLVTQAQWFSVLKYNFSSFRNRENCPEDFVRTEEDTLCPYHPVERVSWNDVQKFIDKLNENDPNYSYRLPTEAELEYAIRGGTQSRYWFGDNDKDIEQYAWVNLNSGQESHPVKTKPANPWGLYDAVGNVWQWTQDLYTSTSPSDPQVDPTGPSTGSFRVMRGGSWYSQFRSSRSAHRSYARPTVRNNAVGFRLVRTKR